MKVAIVSGASSGMGREFVRQIATNYLKLDEIWVISRRKERLLALESEIKTKLRIFDYDLTQKDNLMALYEELETLNPDVKILVNAAGYGKYSDFTDGDYEEQIGMVDINCRALTALTYMVLPHMSKRSRIINFASAAAFLPQPSFAVYAATKSYVLSFSRALNKELEERGILVIAVCPGPVKTEFFDVANDKKDIPFYKKFAMAKCDKVVAKALKDSALGNEVSVYGIKMKAFRLISKIVPHRLLLKMFKNKK